MSGEAAIAAAMTGSGSTMFAIFADEESRAAARRRLDPGWLDAGGWEVFEVRLPV